MVGAMNEETQSADMPRPVSVRSVRAAFARLQACGGGNQVAHKRGLSDRLARQNGIELIAVQRTLSTIDHDGRNRVADEVCD